MKTVLFRLLLVSLALACYCSCQRHYKIEDRARSQVSLSLDDEIRDFEAGTEILEVKDIKTVYVNDSICILQLKPTLKDSTGVVSDVNLQYVYYLDSFLSDYYGRLVFRDVFLTVPEYSDSEIREKARTVRRTKEDIYQQFCADGRIISKNFDD